MSFPARSSIRIATGDVESIDPAELDGPDALLVADQVFDGLVAYDPKTFAAIPAAAAEWEAVDGGRRFVFHLREGATFHDGTPVEAQDFVFAWGRLADPLTAAPFSFLLEPVAGYAAYQHDVRVRGLSGVRAIDPLTLEVTLVRPWPDFVSVLGHPALAPVPSEVGRLGVGDRPVGNGPYQLRAPVVPGTEIRLQRFDAYGAQPAATERIVFRQFEDPADAWPEFLTDELEIAPIPASLLADAESRFGDAGIVPLERLLYCGFPADHPLFQQQPLRRAVSLAVDRSEISDRVYGGVAVPATGIVPPGVPGYQQGACGALCQLDPDEARGLVRRLPRDARSFAIDVTDSQVGVLLARTLVEQLSAVGLDVRARRHSPSEYAELLAEGGAEMFCLVRVGDYPRQQALLEPLYLSTSPDNRAGVRISAVDELLNEARATASAAAREELYRRAEATALSEMSLVPLVWFRSHYAAKPYVEGFSVAPTGTFDAAALSIAAG